MNNITINSNSNDIKEMEKLFPRAPLKIIAMEGCKELGQKVNDYIVNFRQSSYREELKSPMYATYLQDNYLVDAHCPRFGSGEAKGVLNESVRGKDLFIMTDVCNYSLTYSVNGYVNHMSPDDHYQDLKRLISAANGKEHRLNIITFGLFTDGFEKFDEFHEKGYIDRVITTNLTYLPPAFYEREYFTVADMSKFIALIIDSMNHDVSISSVLSPTDRLHALLERNRKDLAEKNL